nr:hypothetical protein [Psychrobacter sp. PraFG1]UNK06512.1 hypothetical protein MN210_04255 [Psychrobacter sp. PraFG1]
MLQQIKMTQRLGLAYAYLGFWIPTVQKMRYKTNYAPIELLIHGHWQYFKSAPTPEQVLELLATQPLTFNN